MKILLCILFLFIFPFVDAQNETIDSLLDVNSKEQNDSIKIMQLIELGNQVFDTNPDSSIFFYSKAVKFAERFVKETENIEREKMTYLYILSLYQLSYAQLYGMQYIDAEKSLNKALQLTNHSLRHSELSYVKIDLLKGKADILSALGDIYADKGYYTLSLNHYIDAAEISNELVNKNFIDPINLSGRYFSLGLIHYYLKNYDKSLDYYLKSKQISKEKGYEKGVAKCNNNIAILITKQGNYNEALKYLDSTLVYAEKHENLILQAQVFDNMADCFIHKEEYEKAELYLAKSIIITQKLNNIQGEIFVMLGLADLYTKTKQFQKALNYAQKSVTFSKKIGSVSLEKSAYLQLSEIYEQSGSYKKALEFHKKYKSLEDSLFNKEKTRQTEEMEAKYQAVEKQKEIDFQKAELAERDAQISQKRKLNYIYIIIVFILSLILIFIYLGYKRKQKRNKIIQLQNKRITDSIEYAKRIQTAALPSESYLNEIFDSHFIIYKPLQIVSGDFYWAVKKDQYSVLAAADCTGHGVPGAFVSMLGISLLNELTLNSDITGPDKILEEMRFILKRSFGQTGDASEQTDGIDIALCVIDNRKDILYFSAANNPAFLIRGNKIIEMEPVMNPVGIYPKEIPFKLQTYQLEKGDIIYLFTDGYPDQFGGDKQKSEKLTIAAFKKILIEHAQLPMHEQKVILEDQFNQWQKDMPQIDDVLVFAIKY